VALGRDIWHKITAYIRYQMSQLFGLVALFLAAALFNVNNGVALMPMMALFLNFFVAIFPVAAIMTDVADPTVMQEKPRDPSVPIFSKRTGPRWIFYGLVLAAASLAPLAWGPDEPSIDGPSVSMTMAFAVMGMSTAISGLVMRHDRRFALAQPLLRFAGILAIGAVLIVFATELDVLQRWLKTVPLTAPQWGVVLGLALVMPLAVEVDKAIQRLRHRGEGSV
jgi:Ca2+-transporting ATPase